MDGGHFEGAASFPGSLGEGSMEFTAWNWARNGTDQVGLWRFQAPIVGETCRFSINAVCCRYVGRMNDDDDSKCRMTEFSLNYGRKAMILDQSTSRALPSRPGLAFSVGQSLTSRTAGRFDFIIVSSPTIFSARLAFHFTY